MAQCATSVLLFGGRDDCSIAKKMGLCRATPRVYRMCSRASDALTRDLVRIR